MTLRSTLLGALALGLIATAAQAQNTGVGLPSEGMPMSNSSRPPAPETPPGDLTRGTPISQSPLPGQPGYVAPIETTASAPTDISYSAPTSASAPDVKPAPATTTTAMAPIPDTPTNRRLYGGPNSNGGRTTSARGN